MARRRQRVIRRLLEEVPLSSDRAYAIAARLGLATTLSVFSLIVLGSVVRSTGSGLACPDWPLCQGRLIPQFEFHVMVEWLHRTVALVVSLLVFATSLWILFHRALRARLGAWMVLALALLLTQVLLGALTVWKLLHPSVVSSHLAVALLLFAVLLTLTLIAESEAVASGPAPAGALGRSPLLLPTFALATALTYLQAVLGGVVSTNHAGLACPDWPTCFGRWFPPLEGLAGLQMLHRYGAYVLTACMVVGAFAARSAPDAGVRAGATMTLGLTFGQVVLGVCNVLLGTPAWISALHIATAAALLGLLIVVTYRVALLPVSEPRLVAVPAP